MYKYLKTTGIFFGVWFLASLLNGLLSGVSIALLESKSLNEAAGKLFLSIAFSFLFSAPLVAFVWFATVIAQLADKKGDSLFQFVLGAAFFCSMAGALLFACTLGTEFSKARYVAGLCIIISAMASVLFFRKQIKANA